MEAVSWTECVKNKEVLQRVKEDKSSLRTVRTRKASWNGNTLSRNCLLKHVTGGKIEGRREVKRRRGRRRNQLLDDLKETR